MPKLAPAPWPDHGPVSFDAEGFYGLTDEIRVRVLERVVDWTGDEGPVELGKLEALCEALGDAIETSLGAAGRSARFRRTLAGALVTLDEGTGPGRARPAAQAGQARPASKRP